MTLNPSGYTTSHRRAHLPENTGGCWFLTAITITDYQSPNLHTTLLMFFIKFQSASHYPVLHHLIPTNNSPSDIQPTIHLLIVWWALEDCGTDGWRIYVSKLFSELGFCLELHCLGRIIMSKNKRLVVGIGYRCQQVKVLCRARRGF